MCKDYLLVTLTHAASNVQRLLVGKYPPLSHIALIQLSELEQCTVNEFAQGFDMTAEDSIQC